MHEHDFSLWILPPTGKKHSSIQIEDFMVKVIKSRAVLPGEIVPSHRVLARLNNVNRNTTLRAFTKLIATGWLSHSHGSKAVVADPLPNDTKKTSLPIMPDLLPKPLLPNHTEAIGMQKMSPLDFIRIGSSTIQHRPDYLRRALFASSRRNLEEQENYSSTILTANILSHLKLRNFSIQPEHLLVIRGRSDCLKSIFKILYAEKNVILNTAPCDKVVSSIIQQFSQHSIAMDMGTPDFLIKMEQLLEKTKIGIVYLRPRACYPTCRSLDEATCQRLIELAKKYQFYIIEEDDDHEFWWGKSPSIPLVFQDHGGFVIHCAALSRSSPYMQHLRTVIAQEQLISSLKVLPDSKHGYQDYMEERSISQLLRDNGLISVSRQARLSKQKDLKKLYQILQLQLGPYIEYDRPDHGTALWINFPKTIDLKRSFELLKIEGFQLKLSTNLRKQNATIHTLHLDITNFDETECRRISIKLRSLLKSHKTANKK